MSPTFLLAAAALLALGIVFPAAAQFVDERALWALCEPDPPLPMPPPRERPDLGPGATELSADSAELVKDGVSTFTGNVEIVKGAQALSADRLQYDEQARSMDIQGNVRYWDNTLFWSGARANYDADAGVGVFTEGEYRLLESRGHGHAADINHDSTKGITKFRDVEYSTCPINDPVWTFAAGRLRLDHNEEWGVGRNLWLRLYDVPVLYVPYLSFPLSDKRKSGFLAPSFGSTADSGADISIPYYWNIAPEQDATITPRYLGDRGLMLGGQYRYLLEKGEGQLDFEVLPSDRLRDDEMRSLVSYVHQQWLMSSHLYTYLLYKEVSDKEYFEDFSTNLAGSSTRYLERRADAIYYGTYGGVLTRVQDFQTVDNTLPGSARPYQRVPQVYFWYTLPGSGERRLTSVLLGETVYFDRPDTLVGGRVDLRPSISYPYMTPGWFVIPKATLRYTQYFLDNNAPGAEDSPSRTVPIMSLDSGVTLERDISLRGDGYLQTLEPRLFYLYVPETEQDDLPVFDTGQYDFNFAQLFREDRFSGPDRQGDANQMTLALTSRILDRGEGTERFRASVGQIYYFEDPEVSLPGYPVPSGTSALIAEASARIDDAWRVRGTVQWDPDDEDNRTGMGAFGLRYQPSNNRIFNFDYRVRDDIIGLGDTNVEQTDASVYWPLTNQWSMVGRWVYSLRNGVSLETFGGVEYESCCWGMRAVARRFLSSTTGEYETGVFVQLELKGLAGIGGKAESFLEKSIPGYASDF